MVKPFFKRNIYDKNLYIMSTAAIHIESILRLHKWFLFNNLFTFNKTRLNKEQPNIILFSHYPTCSGVSLQLIGNYISQNHLALSTNIMC